MSENKPNDEPKLSTTDRVVKCKCKFCVHFFFLFLRPQLLPLTRQDLEEFTVVAAGQGSPNVVEIVCCLWRKKGVSRAVRVALN